MDPAQETVTESSNKADKNTLEALRYDWDKAYEIDGAGDEWCARRLDGLGGWMHDANAEGLRNQILSDYLTKPVPQQAMGRMAREGARP